MGGTCIACGDMRNVYKILVGKPERKRPFGTPRRRWEFYSEMNLAFQHQHRGRRDVGIPRRRWRDEEHLEL
jgi:hypothetical protein